MFGSFAVSSGRLRLRRGPNRDITAGHQRSVVSVMLLELDGWTALGPAFCDRERENGELTGKDGGWRLNVLSGSAGDGGDVGDGGDGGDVGDVGNGGDDDAVAGYCFRSGQRVGANSQ